MCLGSLSFSLWSSRSSYVQKNTLGLSSVHLRWYMCILLVLDALQTRFQVMIMNAFPKTDLVLFYCSINSFKEIYKEYDIGDLPGCILPSPSCTSIATIFLFNPLNIIVANFNLNSLRYLVLYRRF